MPYARETWDLQKVMAAMDKKERAGGFWVWDKDLARLLGVSHRTVRRWISSGLLQAHPPTTYRDLIFFDDLRSFLTGPNVRKVRK